MTKLSIYKATCQDTGCQFRAENNCQYGLYNQSSVFTCTNLDLCTASSCDPNAACTMINEFDYECECKTGFTGNGTVCYNENECDDLDACDSNAACTDSVGSFECECNSGFVGNGFNCSNIDECDLGYHNCLANAACIDTEGSFDCVCLPGYGGDGVCEPCSADNVCQAYSCEHSVQGDVTATIECPTGTKIKINSAIYGRAGSDPINVCSHPNGVSTCRNSSDHYASVSLACDEMSTCEYHGTNSLGDPCGGVGKYTIIEYICVENIFTTQFKPFYSNFNTIDQIKIDASQIPGGQYAGFTIGFSNQLKTQEIQSILDYTYG